MYAVLDTCFALSGKHRRWTMLDFQCDQGGRNLVLFLDPVDARASATCQMQGEQPKQSEQPSVPERLRMYQMAE